MKEDKKIIISGIIATLAMVICGLYITINGNNIGLVSLVSGILMGIIIIAYHWWKK